MAVGALNGRRLWLVYALFSFAAVASGGATLYLSGSAPGLVSLNSVAWLAGAAASFAIMASGGHWVRTSAVPIAVAGLGAVFLFPDVDGVHRWLNLGPLAVNAAALLLPVTIVAIAQTGIRTPISIAASFLILGILILQPDASQVTAFAVAVSVMLAYSDRPGRVKAMALMLLLASIAFAWMRPDGLQPVPQSELVIELAWRESSLLAAVSLIALAGAALIPLARRNPLPSTGETQALTGYFLAAALCTFVGHYPVPMVGLGMSFVVGYWLGIGLLCSNYSR